MALVAAGKRGKRGPVRVDRGTISRDADNAKRQGARGVAEVMQCKVDVADGVIRQPEGFPRHLSYPASPAAAGCAPVPADLATADISKGTIADFDVREV